MKHLLMVIILFRSAVVALPLPDKATLLFVHAHPDDEYIFGGGTLPYYSQVRQLPVAVVSMTTKSQDGSYPLYAGDGSNRITELRNALDVYAGQTVGSGSINANGYYETGNITMIEGGLRDSGSYNNRDATKAWEKWDGSLGNSDGLADGRYAAAYTIARAIRLFRPEVVVTCHDLEGDYGHADHTASSVATTEGYELAANANVDIEGLPAWQAKKLYLRGDDFDNRDAIQWSGNPWGTFTSDGGIHPLFHDHFEETSIGGSTPRDIANLGMVQHDSQADHPVVTVFDYYAQFDGHYSEWFTLYRTEVGSDMIEANFTVVGDLTSTTYSGWSRGDFFGNLTIFADRDYDLLSDSWELHYFVDLAAADPTADDDQDGHDNNYEFIVGLDPQTPDDLDMQISSASQTVEFTLPAATGTGYDGLSRRYQLKFSPDLIDWDTVVAEGTADGTTVVYAIPSDLSQGFYRLVITLE
jgi:LmbE family N-acetylglucosaminyl deacetylase